MNYALAVLSLVAVGIATANILTYHDDGGGLWSIGIVTGITGVMLALSDF